MEHSLGSKPDIVKRFASEFAKLLELEGLRAEDFLRPLSEYDEVPICTRLARLSFLDELPHEERSVALFALALEFLEGILACSNELPEDRALEFFVMITLLDWDEFDAGGLAMPRFWITTRATDELLPMQLVPPYTAEANRVHRWLVELGCASAYLVGDDPNPPPEGFPLRVHVGAVALTRAGMPRFSGLLRDSQTSR